MKETEATVIPGSEGVAIEFPQVMDIRVIHTKEGSENIVEELGNLYAKMGIECTVIQTVKKPEGKYAKTGSRLTITSLETMREVYKNIQELPYVKAII